MLRPTCIQKSLSLSHRFGLYSTELEELDCGRCLCIGGECRGDGGGWCHSLRRELLRQPSLWCLLLSSPSLLSSSSLSSLSSVSRWEGRLPPAARHACHDGSAPHVSDWTPLYEEENEADDEEECQHKMNVKETTKKKNKPRNRPGGRQRSEKAKQTTLKLVINSGTTSHFLREEENLPKIGGTSTTIYLPDDSTMKATTKVQLPIPELPNKARDAIVIVVPGLKRNLGSVSKFSDAGYTTVSTPEKRESRSMRLILSSSQQPYHRFSKGAKVKDYGR
jgi:hypothetical protein